MSRLPVYALCRHRIMTDGFGVTTLVAVHGCPLKCAYCINPEAHRAETKITLFTPQELFDLLSADDLYFQATGGGVTFGGGEPLMHAEFIREFIKLVNGRWRVNIETSLNVPLENALVNADMYIADIKDTDESIYRAYTGCGSGTVIKNLENVVSALGGDRITVRVPHIKGFNTEKNVSDSINRLKALGITHFDEFSYIIKA